MQLEFGSILSPSVYIYKLNIIFNSFPFPATHRAVDVAGRVADPDLEFELMFGSESCRGNYTVFIFRGLSPYIKRGKSTKKAS